MGAIYKVQGKDPACFTLALQWAVGEYPNAAWYYLADDDSFVVLDRLAQVASRYNWSENHFIGVRHGVSGRPCGVANFECRQTTITGCQGPGWDCGGPGVLISAALAQLMAKAQCAENYRGKWNCAGAATDVQLACCAADAWGSGYYVDDDTMFLYDLLYNPTADISIGAVAIHHISPNTTVLLGQKYNAGACKLN
eukprot:gnl/TRDRNA2_/TRDRNA2_177424_c4_seq6.p1 gnl/TRDRNA2_/TRDRNA2_177424_c4~~gnl/TRDRNA2_/TRDRNA2_177424_c4_seq6.p1  ORF type:complete len:196 (+),score=11.20 gnl/TRDRNA2_/TRDRNA2_177424_c4_seq6:2-589(+)